MQAERSFCSHDDSLHNCFLITSRFGKQVILNLMKDKFLRNASFSFLLTKVLDVCGKEKLIECNSRAGEMVVPGAVVVAGGVALVLVATVVAGAVGLVSGALLVDRAVVPGAAVVAAVVVAKMEIKELGMYIFYRL